MVLLFLAIVAVAWAFFRLWRIARRSDGGVDPQVPTFTVESLFDSGDIADLESRFEDVERDLRNL